MKKIYLYISLLIGIVASFIPSFTFAANSSNLPQIFNPGTDDLSIKYLGQVFGTVGSVIHSSGGQLLGKIFGTINVGLLILAGGVIAYTIIIGIINTASDGEIMGKKLNSFWVVLRTVLGIGALVPTASGYSTVQILVMWVVVQSIGLANYTWSTALDYLGKEGGVAFVTSKNTSVNNDGAMKSLAVITDILRSQTCVNMLNDRNTADQSVAEAEYRKDPNNSFLRDMANGNSNNTAGVRYEASATESTASFGTKESPALCGKYNLIPDSLAGKADIVNSADVGFKQVVLTLQPIAKKMVQFKEDPSADPKVNKDRKEQLNNAVKMGLVNATIDYENILAGAKRQSVDDADKQWKEDIEVAKKEGWISAGSYYRNLGTANQRLQNQASNYQIQQINAPKAAELSSIVDATAFEKNNKIITDQASNAKPELMSVLQSNINSYKNIVDPGKATAVLLGGTAALTGGTMAASILFPALLPVMSGLTVVTGTTAIITGIWLGIMNQPGDPIMKLQTLGAVMTGGGTALWVGLTAAITGVSSIGSIMSFVSPIPFAISHALQPFMPVVTAITGVLFITGLTLGVYVPLIPFLIFTFAAIGWIIFVLEAMAAAPLVALGITHPEGHDLLGKSEQALMLLLSVFLRPVMMILGLVAGIIVAQVSINMLNAGVGRIIESTGVIGSGLFIFGIFALMIIYTMTVLTIINMSFNLIVLLDQKVKAWIGLHPDHSNFDHQLQEIKGGMVNTTQGISGGMNKLAEGGSAPKPGSEGDAKLATGQDQIKAKFGIGEGAKGDKTGGGTEPKPPAPGTG